MKNNKFHSGFVSVIGRPNVGKSTLTNNLIGQKISIVSNKPQTTRNKIRLILTQDDYQIVFLDTPGIHIPKSKLGTYMVKSANTTLNEVDIILYLIEPSKKIGEQDNLILQKLETVETPVFLVINKIDTVEKEELLEVINVYSKRYNFKEIIPISAFEDTNTDTLLDLMRKNLPEGPKYFDEDLITDEPERQIVAELIREKALRQLNDEIPHGIAVVIEKMTEKKDIVNIEATIYCERDSHKGIIIGKKGERLKKIGSSARIDIERLLGTKVFLQTWVKVKKDWRDSDFLLRNFGYDKKEI